MAKAITALYRTVTPGEGIRIQIVCNHMTVKVSGLPKRTPKYKKVNRSMKLKLVELVDSGYSIVAVKNYLILVCFQAWNQLFDSQIYYSGSQPGAPG